MKGILSKTDKGWIVKYIEDIPEKEITNKYYPSELQLPLHPDDANNMALQSNWLLNGKEVEFEIVRDKGCNCEYMNYKEDKNCEERNHYFHMAKLTLSAPPSKNKGWDDIMDKFDEWIGRDERTIGKLAGFLRAKYNPPTPLKQ